MGLISGVDHLDLRILPELLVEVLNIIPRDTENMSYPSLL